jgi:ribosomal-protein-alanine N-acetyltransferase
VPMISRLGFDIRFVETSNFHAGSLSNVHQACFIASWSPKDVEELLILPNVFGVMAEIMIQNKDSLIGFILCSATHEECEILTISVLPDWRRQGIGRLLLEYAGTKIKHTNVKKIFLEVAENNNAARRLYFDQGFEEIGRRPRYYRQLEGRVDAIQLAKKP